MVDHPKREWSSNVTKDKGTAQYYNKYAVVRGIDPVARGPVGSVLAFAKEDVTGKIVQVALAEVDGEKVKADTWYSVDLQEREVELL